MFPVFAPIRAWLVQQTVQQVLPKSEIVPQHPSKMHQSFYFSGRRMFISGLGIFQGAKHDGLQRQLVQAELLNPARRVPSQVPSEF